MVRAVVVDVKNHVGDGGDGFDSEGKGEMLGVEVAEGSILEDGGEMSGKGCG